jgi:hypothetical protein
MNGEEPSSWLHRLALASEDSLDQDFEDLSKKAFIILKERSPHPDYSKFKADFTFRLSSEDIQHAFTLSKLEEDAAQTWKQAAENRNNIDDPIKKLEYLKAAEARYYAAERAHKSWQKFMEVKSFRHEPLSRHHDWRTGIETVELRVSNPEEMRARRAEISDARTAHQNAIDAYNEANEKLSAIHKS